jgi:hypothetical protein
VDVLCRTRLKRGLKQPSVIKHEWRDALLRHFISRRYHTSRAHILQKKIILMLIYCATTPRMRHRGAISSCFSRMVRPLVVVWFIKCAYKNGTLHSVVVWFMKCAYKNGTLHCYICTQIWRRWINISCKYHHISLM